MKAIDGRTGTDPKFTAAAEKAAGALRRRHGDEERERIERGVGGVLRFWRAEDGDADSLRAFLEEEFIALGETLDATFERLEYAFERIGGYFLSLGRDLRRGLDLDLGTMLPIDGRLAAFDAGSHLGEDLFTSRIAFIVLLNFPLTTLEERLREGPRWSRRRWAEARMTQGVARRVPAEVNQALSEALTRSDAYISSYNIHLHHLLSEAGERPFPAGLRLISHWGLRDELKARYADREGLAKQRLIHQVMTRIVRQEIPAAVIDNPRFDWTPATNAVARTAAVEDVDERPAGGNGRAAGDASPGQREPDERYRQWMSVFQAVRRADPYHPDCPTLIDRRFLEHREIPEAEVVSLFQSVLDSPLSQRVAALAAGRLERPLEPFDVWYSGFRPHGEQDETALDAGVRERYPSAEAFAADLPRLLGRLGFSEEKARFLARRIVVEGSRGAGHAFGAARADDKAHLRTRVANGGMDYKGFNIAIHELGHNVEQVFSVSAIDHPLLMGVPNTGCTEAIAFVFQNRNLELLDLPAPGAQAGHEAVLDTFWSTREIAGVALVDIAAWHWLYENPEATPAEFRDAVVEIAATTWNRWYEPLLGGRGEPLLAIYSHLVDGMLYTPDYPLGHIIAFQIEEHMRQVENFGAEVERICRQGHLTPDAWMKGAVGAPLSTTPLLEATERALNAIE